MQRTTLTNLAKLLGISRQRATVLKRQGMPTDSAPAARAWIAAYVGQQGAKGIDLDVNAVPKPPDLGPMPEGDDAEAALYRCRHTERATYELLVQRINAAKESKDAGGLRELPALLRIYGQHATNRIALEHKHERHRIRAGELVTVEFAKGLIEKTLAPLDAQLRQLPKLAAASANPADPIAAERAIGRALNTFFDQVADARKAAS